MILFSLEIGGPYPCNIEKSDKVLAVYRDSGLVLSVSGHYHKGIDMLSREGVSYLTAPAFCELPFPCIELEIKGSDVNVSEKTLAPEELVWDTHCHTEFAL